MLHLLDACIAVNIALDPIVKAATYCVQKKHPLLFYYYYYYRKS